MADEALHDQEDHVEYEAMEGEDGGEGGEDYAGDEEIPVDGAEGAESIEAMKKKLKEMEEEAARLKQAVGGGEAGTSAGTSAQEQADKAEMDSRSIYVGSVDYSCTPEELQQHFQSCGTVNRVTILTDKFGNPKGYAYIEFLEVDAVTNAMLLDNTELRGRNIKVMQKRTNTPGLKARGRGRGRGGYMGGRGMAMYGMPMPMFGMPVPMYAPRGRGAYGGYGAPRGRGRGRGFYAPY